MKIISLQSENPSEVLNESLEILQKGGLVIFPSDTVYGLLVDATNELAVKKLIQFKNRPWGKPISVFVSGFDMLNKQVITDHRQTQILEELLPGPFTVILESHHLVSLLLESEKGTLGVRIPLYPLIEKLVNQFGKPITATSANLSGRSSHYSVQTLLKELPESKKKLIDLIVDAGKLPRNKNQAPLRPPAQSDVLFLDKKTYFSHSPEQTKKIARFILQKIVGNKKLEKPLIFIIKGELGVGKTIFVKGMGEFLGIPDIISPTFVVYYEYASIHRFIDTFVHVDLYNVQDPEEFKHLRLEKYLEKGNAVCFEWGEKAGEIMNKLKDKGRIIYVEMKYVNEKEREIKIRY